jgi:glycerol-3-phosphate dehydrogenase
VQVSAAGLVSILGGKWTTYRKMAEDGVDRAAEVGGLRPKPCRSQLLPIHGALGGSVAGALSAYGSDGPAVGQLASSRPDGNRPLDDRLPEVAAQVVWAARQEMARTVEDVLSRRLRTLLIDAEAALAAAPRVAELLADELGRSAAWQKDQLADFRVVAEKYRRRPGADCRTPTVGEQSKAPR